MICEPQLSDVLPDRVLDGALHYVETLPGDDSPIQAIVRIVQDRSNDQYEQYELQVVRLVAGDSWFRVGQHFYVELDLERTESGYPRKRLWTLTPFALILWPQKAA